MSIYTRIIDLQKLHQAWNKIKKNKPACGADNITVEMFDANVKEELKQLQIELEQEKYEVFPVRIVAMKRDNKVRDISLYCMRDKVVQASIATELNKIYESKLSGCAYAYRSNLSALLALEKISGAIMSNNYKYVFKADIKAYFDNIRHDTLRNILEKEIKEKDVIDLIFKQLCAPAVDFDGELTEKNVGIYQGSGISPILSNIYLNMVDKTIEKEDCLYIRYADDMIILTKEKKDAELTINILTNMLSDLGLELSESKTCFNSIEKGFDFLGYHFDSTGKSIPIKATEKLSQRLEDVWLTMVGISLEERLKKGSQILNGWEQYYRDEREVRDIYEYVVLVYMMRHKDELIDFSAKRVNFHNTYKDIALYLIGVWKENNLYNRVIFEYEEYFDICHTEHNEINEMYTHEIIDIYDKLIVLETRDEYTNLMQAYSDVGLYDCAEKIMDKIKCIENMPTYEISAGENNDENQIIYDERSFALMEESFVGREDMYSREVLDNSGKRKGDFIPEPMSREVLTKHLKGHETIGTYMVRNNDTVHYLIFDYDISKRVLLGNNNEAIFADYLDKAKKSAYDCICKLKDMGITGYMEFSGYRGYHVWIFFSEWVPIRYVYSLIEIVEGKIDNLPDGVTLEYFPTKNKKKSGYAGQYIKIPYGIHLLTGRRSYMCYKDCSPAWNVNDFLCTLARYSIESIKRIIGANISAAKDDDNASKLGCGTQIKLDYEKLGTLESSIRVVLSGCNLMKYLVHKAMSTGYLSHLERLSVLHVFGHLGEEGKEFVHTVMSYTMNYQYHITQRFIEHLPQKPVSCIKLREQYKMVTAEYGCNCIFKRTKDCYPSPVIHALRNNSEDNHEITIPSSRTITKAKKGLVYDELNMHSKVQELANKMVELKKQKRGIDKSVAKVERELCVLFDNAKVDCLEVDMGMLVRRKNDDKYDWLIEI